MIVLCFVLQVVSFMPQDSTNDFQWIQFGEHSERRPGGCMITLDYSGSCWSLQFVNSSKHSYSEQSKTIRFSPSSDLIKNIHLVHSVKDRGWLSTGRTRWISFLRSGSPVLIEFPVDVSLTEILVNENSELNGYIREYTKEVFLLNCVFEELKEVARGKSPRCE